jgi:hypothetical protein
MRKILAICALFAVGLSGCTARVNNFKGMAEIGQSYERSVVKVVDSARSSGVDANSARLLAARDLAAIDKAWPSAIDPLAYIEQLNEADRASLDALDKIEAHAQQLERYFTALLALAAFDGDSEIAASAERSAQALTELAATLGTAKLGGAPLPALAKQSGPLVVSALKSRALERELRLRGPMLLDNLDLQRRLLAFLADRVTADSEFIAENQMTRTVAEPYADLQKSIAGFADARRELLLRSGVDAAPFREAELLAGKLHDAIIALAEGRIDASDLALYAADMSRLIGLIETAGNKGAQP